MYTNLVGFNFFIMTDFSQEEAKGFGLYLAQLLDASSLSGEQKQAWATLVPDMDLEQLLKFAAVLEKYVPEPLFQDMVALRDKLQGIKERHDEKIEALNQKTQSKLLEVINEVQAAEQAQSSS